MSDITAEAVDAGASLDSTPEPAIEAVEVPAEPVADADLFTITVDGAEQQVHRDELLKGYQRQADYTRKTQELAAQRAEAQQALSIAAALEANPEGTLKALAEAYGLNLDTQSAEAEELDPEEARLRRIEEKFAAQERKEQQAALDAEVARLKHTYGEFDEFELFNHAMKHGITNLEVAYAHQHFNKPPADPQKEEQVVEEKRAAAVVESGTASQTGAVAAAQPKPRTLREAWAQAKQQHGLA